MVSYSRARTTALTVVGTVLLVISAMVLGSHYLGHGRVGRTLSSGPLPPGLSPSPGVVPATSTGRTLPRAMGAEEPGIPLAVIVAGHHLYAAVSANPLNADGSLYVPANPRAVSWASQDVGPGSSYGTTILVSHINYGGVQGAFFDLADYQVGQLITVVLADGRQLKYTVAAPPIEVNKDTLGARRQELFDQSHSYGQVGHPKSGRLLLLSCGGVFDNRTGHYESNIFVFALPV